MALNVEQMHAQAGEALTKLPDSLTDIEAWDVTSWTAYVDGYAFFQSLILKQPNFQAAVQLRRGECIRTGAQQAAQSWKTFGLDLAVLSQIAQAELELDAAAEAHYTDSVGVARIVLRAALSLANNRSVQDLLLAALQALPV